MRAGVRRVLAGFLAVVVVAGAVGPIVEISPIDRGPIGSAQALEVDENSTVVSDWEDGTAEPDHPNWSFGTDTEWSTSITNDSISGEFSLNMVGGNNHDILYKTESDGVTPASFEVKIRPENLGNQEVRWIMVDTGDTFENPILWTNGEDRFGNQIQEGEVYHWKFTNVDWSGNYDIELEVNGSTYTDENAGSTVSNLNYFWIYDADGGVNITIDDVVISDNPEGYSQATNDISGQVRNQDDNPIANATVELWGVDHDQLSPSGLTTKAEEAREQLQSGAERLPDDFDSAVDPLAAFRGEVTSSAVTGNLEGRYALVTTTTISGGPWLDSADLGQPRLQLPANEELVAVIGDPEGSIFGALDEYDRQVPGRTVGGDDLRVVATEIGPGGDPINAQPFDLDETAGGGFGDVSSLRYATLELPPGYYRIHPDSASAGDGGPNLGPIYQVGTTQEIVDTIDQNLQDVNDTTSEIAQFVQDKITDNTWTRTTVETDENGKFSASVSASVQTVGIQVIGASGDVLADYTNPSLEDLRTEVEQGYNGSVIVSSAPKIVEAPATDVEIEAVELSSPPQLNLSDFINDSRWRERLLDELNYGNVSDVMDRLLNQSNATREHLEDVQSNLSRLSERNERLEERFREFLNASLAEDISIDVEEATDGELRKRIGDLRRSLSELRDTIASEPPEVVEQDSEERTVSVRFPFETDLSMEDVAVSARYSNGTVRPVDRSYLSIDGSLLPGATEAVVISEYPLGDAASVSFQVDVARPNGLATASKRVDNQAVDGAVSPLDSIALSTLRPGPDETVTAELHPEDSTEYRNITGIEVYGPSGASVTAHVTGAREVNWTTAGAGDYLVRITYVNPGGQSGVVSFGVEAGDQGLAMPAGVRVGSGPAAGTYALVGDALESGDVDVAEGGGAVDITAVVAEDADVPTKLHVYATGAEMDPDATVSIDVVRGSDRAGISRHVRIIAHLQAVPDDALLRRNGEPLPRGESTAGTVEARSDSLVVTSYTDDGASLDIQTNSNPSVIDRAWWTVQYRTPDFDVPFLAIIPLLGGVCRQWDGVPPPPTEADSP